MQILRPGPGIGAAPVCVGGAIPSSCLYARSSPARRAARGWAAWIRRHRPGKRERSCKCHRESGGQYGLDERPSTRGLLLHILLAVFRAIILCRMHFDVQWTFLDTRQCFHWYLVFFHWHLSMKHNYNGKLKKIVSINNSINT